ncbi:hypothetical protein ACFLSJ_01480 [Verrucomicrobiota bacterium]
MTKSTVSLSVVVVSLLCASCATTPHVATQPAAAPPSSPTDKMTPAEAPSLPLALNSTLKTAFGGITELQRQGLLGRQVRGIVEVIEVKQVEVYDRDPQVPRKTIELDATQEPGQNVRFYDLDESLAARLHRGDRVDLTARVKGIFPGAMTLEVVEVHRVLPRSE